MYKILFLGDRRIAQGAITIINALNNKGIEVAALVSSIDFYNGCKKTGIEIPIFIDNKKNDEEKILEVIRTNDINMLISVQHNWILTNRLLQSVNYMAFNLHNAKLPDYKGYNSISHSIINGDSSFYTTIHWMVAKVDSGDIAYEKEIKIESNDTALSLYDKTVKAATDIFQLFVKDLLANQDPPKRKITGEGVFYKKDDLLKFKDVTNLSIERAGQIARAVYFPPHEPAFIIQNNNKIHLVPESNSNIAWKDAVAAYSCNW